MLKNKLNNNLNKNKILSLFKPKVYGYNFLSSSPI